MNGLQMRECRKSMKLGQVEFGRLMGYTGTAKTVKDTVYKYEGGKRQIPPMVARLAWLLSELYKAGIAPEFPNWPHYQLENRNEANDSRRRNHPRIDGGNGPAGAEVA